MILASSATGIVEGAVPSHGCTEHPMATPALPADSCRHIQTMHCKTPTVLHGARSGLLLLVAFGGKRRCLEPNGSRFKYKVMIRAMDLNTIRHPTGRGRGADGTFTGRSCCLLLQLQVWYSYR